jgi:hypothetical protein
MPEIGLEFVDEVCDSCQQVVVDVNSNNKNLPCSVTNVYAGVYACGLKSKLDECFVNLLVSDLSCLLQAVEVANEVVDGMWMFWVDETRELSKVYFGVDFTM